MATLSSKGGDLYGDGVNIAARLEALAEPGGICLTAKVRDEVGGKLDIGFEDLGAIEMKNVDAPVRVFRVTAPGGERKVLALPDKPSIAVLPFANMSGDPEQAYFSDGITEDIITELSRFRSLFVIARNSSFVYREQAVDLRKVGRELGVRYVVEGSVRRAASRVRITAQLIEAETGTHIWAERYDRDITNIFEVQDEITGMIAAKLSDRLNFAEEDRRQRRNAADPTAYDLLLRGTAAYSRFAKDGNAESRQWCEKAIEIDPRFAAPHHRLAWTYLIDFELGWHGSSEDRATKARAAAQRAIALDPADARGEMTLAYACVCCGDWAAAEIHSRRAIDLNRNDAEVVTMCGYIDTCLGDAACGFERMEQALRLNPFAPDYYHWVAGICLFVLGRYSEALAAFQQMMNVPTVVHAKIGACLAQLDRIDEARLAMAEFLRLTKAEQRSYPGEDLSQWRSYFAHSLRSRDPDQLDRWIDAFCMAGLTG